MDTAQWLSAQIETHGLTQTEVAKAVGVTPKAVCNWVNGTFEPSERNRKQLKSYLNSIETDKGDLIYPPYSHYGSCSSCSYLAPCRKRVLRGLHAMCEAVPTREIKWARKNRLLHELLWWK